LRTCAGKGEVIIVVQDTQDAIFGGYFSQTMEIKQNYFGTGESFLFTLAKEGLVVYRSTMQNIFFCYCNVDGIGFGSDPHFGLFIDSSLTAGSTHGCQTFNNKPLSGKSHFTVKRLEVFGFKHNLY
jgi:hypothetical protein